jgi:beta-phosphoglucomutase family hydrolase
VQVALSGISVTTVLGLPDTIRACLFDLDGVLTPTAKVHAAAWKELFDDFLRQRAARTGEPFVPFDPVADYLKYVDGRPRADGTRTFLASRQISLPESGPGGAETVESLSARKDALFVKHVAAEGVQAYEGSRRYLRAAQEGGLRRAVVSASAHCEEIIHAAGIADLLEVRVDGVVARAQGLPGKPKPDTFLAAAQLLGVTPAQAAVFEDALAGVEAGRAGGFGVVVGVDRANQSAQLKAHGADIVVTDLADLLDRT